MPVSNYPLQNIHLPPHHPSLRICKLISLTGGVVISVFVIVIFLDWLLSLHIVTPLLGKSFINAPMVAAFIASCVVIFLYNRTENATLQGTSKIITVIGLLLFTIGWCT